MLPANIYANRSFSTTTFVCRARSEQLTDNSSSPLSATEDSLRLRRRTSSTSSDAKVSSTTTTSSLDHSNSSSTAVTEARSSSSDPPLSSLSPTSTLN